MRRVRIFGSVARGEAGADSDVGLLVDAGPQTSGWFPVGLILELEALLGRRLDVVTQAGLRPEPREAVMRPNAFRSPNTVAFVERFIQTLGQECLDHFVIFGERHLNHLCSVFVDYYHGLRPHQGKDNELLVAKRGRRKKAPAETISLSEVRCQRQLGGLLKHYYRAAA